MANRLPSQLNFQILKTQRAIQLPEKLTG